MDKVGSWKEMGSGARRWLAIGLTLGLVGGVAWLARWLIQGEGIIYTDIARAFWVPDATLGWVETSERWVWLGLDGLAIVTAVVIGTAMMLYLGLKLARREAGRAVKIAKVMRGVAMLGAGVAMLAPIMPAWAFVSGMPPQGAVRLLPETKLVAAAPDSVAPTLAVTAKQWVAANVPATLVVAQIAAGGETFDAKFGPLTATLQMDPAALATTSGKFEVPAATINTGVELRNTHAAGYLEAEKFPTIAVTVVKVGQLQASGTGVGFTADGEVALMGKSLPVVMTGTVVALDVGKRSELQVNAPEALLVTVSFKLKIAQTLLKRENFDADELTLTGRIVLVPGAPNH